MTNSTMADLFQLLFNLNTTLEEEETGNDPLLGDEEDGEEAKKIALWKNVLLALAQNPKNVNGITSFLHNQSSPITNWTAVDLTPLIGRRHDTGRMTLIIVVYSVLILVSLFGNLLVCNVVLRTRRLHTVTNTFLANLAVSDLLMTLLNIPFTVTRLLLDDWPFGSAMCSVVPFVQVTSVYVSSFTMVAIALDRYQVIVHPLKPRIGQRQGSIIIVIIWLVSGSASLPYSIYNQVVKVYTYRQLTRCQARYPPPPMEFRKWLTLATFLTQYVLPLFVTFVAYLCISKKVWWRAVVGATIKQQVHLRLRGKKKTVKMLLIVVLLFALCWLPLNIYHLYADFSTSIGPQRHSSTIFFICHWFAMSSICYNPFIYCWLNDHFRAGAKAWLMCIGRKVCRCKTISSNEDFLGIKSSTRDSFTASSSAIAGPSDSVRRKNKESLKKNRVGGTARNSSSDASEIQIPLQNMPPKFSFRLKKTPKYLIRTNSCPPNASRKNSSKPLTKPYHSYSSMPDPGLFEDHREPRASSSCHMDENTLEEKQPNAETCVDSISEVGDLNPSVNKANSHFENKTSKSAVLLAIQKVNYIVFNGPFFISSGLSGD